MPNSHEVTGSNAVPLCRFRMNRLYFCHNAAALPAGVFMDEEIVVSLSSDTEDAVSYPMDVITLR